jgi:hypothetical protein
MVAWSALSLFLLNSTGWAGVVDRLILAAGFILVALPSLFAVHRRSRDHVADTFRQVLDRAADLEAVRREHFKARSALDAAVERVEAVRDDLDGMASQVRDALENMNGLQKELVERRQDLGNAKRDIRKWEDAAVCYYQLLERILSHDALPQEYRNYVEKSVADFSRLVEPLGLTLIRPNPGDLFNERDCMIGEADPEGEDVHRVTRCTSWGFRRSDGTVMKAVVAVPLPETLPSDGDSQELGRRTNTQKPMRGEQEGV